MKKLFFIIIILVSCNQDFESEYDFREFPKIEHGQKFENEEDIIKYVSHEIKPKKEIKDRDHWQTPNETWELKTGDCEDFCIIAIYILKTELNIDSNLIIIKIINGYHAAIETNNAFYDVSDLGRYYSKNYFNTHFEIVKKITIIELFNKLPIK